MPKELASPRLFRMCLLAGCASLLLLASPGGVPNSEAQSLSGSRASLLRQNRSARTHGYTYLRTGSQVHEFARRGLLVRLRGNSSYRVGAVSFPYARPEVKVFVERLGRQYKSACGEKLVVTSLTRPITRQPPNASHLSVHPTGMALDLRRSRRASCRDWLEKTLLTLEERGVLEATRESHPPHYHVSLFPRPYMTYLASRGESPRLDSGSEIARASSKRYRVSRGDTLWHIARRHGTSVAKLKSANGIRSSRLKPGQVLQIPVR